MTGDPYRCPHGMCHGPCCTADPHPCGYCLDVDAYGREAVSPMAARDAMRDAGRSAMRAALVVGPYADAAEHLARALWALADADPDRCRTEARAAEAAAADVWRAERDALAAAALAARREVTP